MASIRSVGTQVASATNVATPTNLTPGLPGTRVNGDLLLLFTSCRTNGARRAVDARGLDAARQHRGHQRPPRHLRPRGRRHRVGADRLVDGPHDRLARARRPVQAQIACVAGLRWSSAGVSNAVDVLGAAGNQTASTTAAAGGAAISTTVAGAVVFTLSTRQDDAGTWATLAVSDTITWAKVAATFTQRLGRSTPPRSGNGASARSRAQLPLRRSR